ncbi:MAG TPA: hypothetical protein VGB41_01565 [Acidimicrobiia bacterium]
MTVTFLLLLLMVQVASAMTARSAADAAVAASVRRVVVAEATADSEGAALADEISTLIPGAEQVTATVRVTRRSVVAVTRFRWSPPGPVLSKIWIAARAEVPRVFEP